MSAVLRTADRLPGRTAAGKAACAVGYVALAWLFGGAAGFALAVLIVVSRWAFALPARYFWIGALGALGAAPIAIIAQGLPGSSVVGPEFGEHHLAAHFLVGASLALAAFAGLLDADRTHWRPPAKRRGAAAGGPAAAGALGPHPAQADLLPRRRTAADRAGYVVRLPWYGVLAVGRRARTIRPTKPTTPRPPEEPRPPKRGAPRAVGFGLTRPGTPTDAGADAPGAGQPPEPGGPVRTEEPDGSAPVPWSNAARTIEPTPVGEPVVEPAAEPPTPGPPSSIPTPVGESTREPDPDVPPEPDSGAFEESRTEVDGGAEPAEALEPLGHAELATEDEPLQQSEPLPPPESLQPPESPPPQERSGSAGPKSPRRRPPPRHASGRRGRRRPPRPRPPGPGSGEPPPR